MMNSPFLTYLAVMDFTAGDKVYSLEELFLKGGFIMWLLLILSIVGLFVILVCLFATRNKAVVPNRLVEQAEAFLRKKDYSGLTTLCTHHNSCFARVMLSMANFMQRNPKATMEEVREVASAEGGRQASFLSRQISWLSDIGALAPMLGLLGTVIGMMKTFFEIANGDFAGSKQRIDMAGGVAEALITTAGGLLLAIPALMAYVYFRSRVHKRVADLEAAVTHSVMVAVGPNVRTRPERNSGAYHGETIPSMEYDPASKRDVLGF